MKSLSWEVVVSNRPICNEQGDCRIKFARANKEAYYTTTRLAVYRAHKARVEVRGNLSMA